MITANITSHVAGIQYRTLLYDLKKKAKELGRKPENLEFPSDAFEWVKW